MSRKKSTLIFVILTILFIVPYAKGTGGNMRRVKRQTLMMVSNRICNKGQQVCGQLCFDPKLHACHVLEDKKVLCNAGELACGDKCYDPTEASCRGGNANGVSGSSSGSVEDKCPWGQRACGRKAAAVCYDPKVQYCIGDTVTKNNEKTIVPKVPQIVNLMSPFISFPCPSPGMIPCGAKCYDPQKQSCLAQTEPDGATTMKPGEAPIICPFGSRRCVNRCYDPLKEYCPESFLIQAKDYSAGSFPYLFPILMSTNPQPKCPSLQQRCGAKCFDPFREKCLNGTTVCKWNENVCGDVCFDPFKETCHPS